MALLLVGQPLGLAVTLLCQGGKLGLLSAEGGLSPAQLFPQTGVGRCRDGRKGRSNKEEVVKEDPTRLLSSRPKSRGLHPMGALARPCEYKDEALTPAVGQFSSPLGQLPDMRVEDSCTMLW